MKAVYFRLAKIGCWIPIVLLMLASMAHACNIYYLIKIQAGSGNGYIDPVIFILNYFAPVAGVSLVGLILLKRRGLTKSRSVILASIIFLSFTIALIVYGIWFFHKMGDPFRLSNQVWWLKPGKLFGI